MRKIFLNDIIGFLFLLFSTTCHAGEWKKEPFKNIYGQDEWIYTKNGSHFYAGLYMFYEVAWGTYYTIGER